MNGGQGGTNGRLYGTGGLIPLRLWLLDIAIIAIVITVNISSSLMEHPPGQRNFDAWEPWCWEISSGVAFALLVPGLYWIYRRFHWSRLSLPQFLAGQALGWLFYTLSHDAIMVALRHATYAALGGVYDFSHHNLLLQLIYEGRKDVLTCLLMGGIFWADERLRQIPQPTPPETLPTRIEVKSDGRTLYITPAEVIYAEAAGNYVELHLTTSPRPLLLRGTLGEYEKRLAPYACVRIHRSRLLNPAHMRSHAATPSGDLRITLADGRELTGSRRYRAALDGAAITTPVP